MLTNEALAGAKGSTVVQSRVPLSSERGTYKAVEARFWP